ncbi:MAG: hypothetical protein JNJ54_29780 [Myxococcaceae bacterium]|nr:hypothetical protein [Myxococcaceae bacterium]
MHALVLSALVASSAGAEEGQGPSRVRPARAPTFTSTRLSVQPHWPLASFELSAVVTGARNVFFGLDLVAGVPLGWPTKARRRDRLASGWVVMPLIEGSYGGVSGPLCEGVRLCGDRFVVGPGLKFGHGVGVEGEGGVVRPTRMLYAQLGFIAGRVDIRSAPLSPGNAWWEAGLRARVGGHLGSLDVSQPGGASSFSFNVAVVTELILVSPLTRGWTVGGAIGVAF